MHSNGSYIIILQQERIEWKTVLGISQKIQSSFTEI